MILKKIIYTITIIFIVTSITFFTHAQPPPRDLSFCIADLKYDGESIKICEFGEGIESQFKGYDALYGPESLWTQFWNFIASYKLPFWYITKVRRQNQGKALHEMSTHGGKIYLSLQRLECDPQFKKATQQNIQRKITGIVIAHTLGQQNSEIKNFKKKYPSILFLGEKTNHIVRNKLITSKLFHKPKTAAYKPKFIICEKQYHSALAERIISSLNNPILVIKPINASLGKGIIIIEKEKLEETLQLILKKTELVNKYNNNHNYDDEYSYWIKNNDHEFIVEAYAPSKLITVNNKTFDPTMRVIFMLEHYDNFVIPKILGAYWKLPALSLDDIGDLTAKHKSHITHCPTTSAPVDQNDFECATTLLEKGLKKIFDIKNLASQNNY